MLLGIIGTKGVSDEEIDYLRDSIEKMFPINQYYYDTFHNDRFMVSDCDIIGIFLTANSENEEHSLKLVKEVIGYQKPLIIVVRRNDEGKQQNENIQQKEREDNSLRRPTKKGHSVFGRFRK